MKHTNRLKLVKIFSCCAPFLAVAAVLVVPLSPKASAASADEYFNEGVRLFQKKDCRHAITYFQQAQRSNPNDSNALYYEAMCHQMMGSMSESQKLYATLICSFGNTNAGRMAVNALERLNPQYCRQLLRGQKPSADSSTAGSPAAATTVMVQHLSRFLRGNNSDLASLPKESSVRFEREGNLLMIDGYVNNRPQKFVFDTGAEMVAIGKNHLQALGIKTPEGKPTGSSMGVGSTSSVSTWDMTADIQVGAIRRTNFPIAVQEEMSMAPLLGQSFFRDFMYTIDKNVDGNSGTIHFVRKNAGSTTGSVARDPYAVPFVREGNEMVVTAEVNGVTTKMYFDTGASGIAFTVDQLKQVHVSVPEDAVPELHSGVGGSTSGFGFNVSRIRVGPIDKGDVRISAVNAAAMKYPLLGQTFYNDWQYTIDNTNNVIHFLPR